MLLAIVAAAILVGIPAAAVALVAAFAPVAGLAALAPACAYALMAVGVRLGADGGLCSALFYGLLAAYIAAATCFIANAGAGLVLACMGACLGATHRAALALGASPKLAVAVLQAAAVVYALPACYACLALGIFF